MNVQQEEQSLRYIYEHFGRDAQIEKLREEVEEFIEAIKSGDKEHSEEEAGDIMTVLFGIMRGNNLDICESLDVVNRKTDRTVVRIKSGYYERKDDNAQDKCSVD